MFIKSYFGVFPKMEKSTKLSGLKTAIEKEVAATPETSTTPTASEAGVQNAFISISVSDSEEVFQQRFSELAIAEMICKLKRRSEQIQAEGGLTVDQACKEDGEVWKIVFSN